MHTRARLLIIGHNIDGVSDYRKDRYRRRDCIYSPLLYTYIRFRAKENFNEANCGLNASKQPRVRKQKRHTAVGTQFERKFLSRRIEFRSSGAVTLIGADLLSRVSIARHLTDGPAGRIRAPIRDADESDAGANERPRIAARRARED